MFFTNSNKIIITKPPQVAASAVTQSGAYVNMKNFGHITVIATVCSSLSGGTLTIERGDYSVASGTGAAGEAIGFTYAKVLCGSILQGSTAAATNAGTTWAAATNTSGSAIIAELDATECGDTKTYIRALATPQSGAFVGITYILSRPRYDANSSSIA